MMMDMQWVWICLLLIFVIMIQMLGRQIVRHLEEQSLISWLATQVAQNRHFNAAVTADWTGYINQQIASGKYQVSNIMNIDKKNIDFDLNLATTWATTVRKFIISNMVHLHIQ